MCMLCLCRNCSISNVFVRRPSTLSCSMLMFLVRVCDAGVLFVRRGCGVFVVVVVAVCVGGLLEGVV